MSHEGSSMKTADVGGGPVALSSDIPGNDTKDGDKIHKSKRELKYRFKDRIKPDKWVFEGELLPYGNFPERKMAIKVLGESEYEERLLHFDDEKVITKRMIREAEYSLELIHHPNIVQYIHSCGGGDMRIFIFMELCHEKTLEDRIRDLDNFAALRNPKYCKAILLHITQAIHYMHSRNPPICHRDIKPSNILFSRDEKVVKISDFGYSKKVKPGTQMISSTKSTGTDTYRAPETYEDRTQKTTNCLSDVFSLGIVYFYVLSQGNHPFGKTTEEQIFKIAHKKNKVLQGLVGPDGALARDLINGMLECVRDERPSTNEILKHPYFWSVQKIVGFYNRVVDQLEPPDNKEREKEEPLQANVSDCVAEILERNTCLASHPHISESVENQVHLFFAVSEIILGIKEFVTEGISESTAHMQETKKRETFKTLLSKPFFDNLTELAQLYIKIIVRIPEALEKSKSDKTEDTETDSDSSDENQNKFWSDGIDNINVRNKPEQTSSASENEEYSNEWTPFDTEVIAEDQNIPLGTIPSNRMNDITDDRAFDDDDDASLEMASKTVRRVLQKGIDKEYMLHLNAMNNFHVIRVLVSAIDEIRQEEDTISSAVEFEIRSPEAKGYKSCNKDPATCSGCTDFPLLDEFIADDHKTAFKNAKKKIKNAVTNSNRKEVIVYARELVNVYEKLRQYGRRPILEGRRNAKLKGAKYDHQLLGDLNELKFRRARYSVQEWRNFSHNLGRLNKSDHVDLKKILEVARKLVDQEIAGSLQTWNECFERERLFHKQQCGNCPCDRLVKMSKGISSEHIYDLIKFIRNKLVHFSANKRSHQGDWMKQEEGILNFVASALPELLPHMFKVMKEELKDFIDENQQLESSFYLPYTQTDLSSLIKSTTTVPESDETFECSVQADSTTANRSADDAEPLGAEETHGYSSEFTPHSVTSTLEIGPTGGQITVGNCFIVFPPGTFPDVQRVSVTGSIDCSTWPKGCDVISPTLHVDLGKIHKPATVRLSTWARPDEGQSPEIKVLTMVDNKWEVVQSSTLQINRLIEFKCINLSRFVACLVAPNSQDIPRCFQPTLFLHKDFIVATVHLQDRILSQSLSQSMTTQLNTKQDKEIQDCMTALKFNSEMDIRLRFRGSRDGVCPYPEYAFSVKIDQAMLSGAKFAKKIYGIPNDVLKERQFDISIDSGVMEKVKRNSCTFAMPPELISENYRRHGEITNVGAFEQHTRGISPHDVMAGGAGRSTRVKEVDTRLNVEDDLGAPMYQGMEHQRIGNLAHNIRPSLNFEDSTSVNKAFSTSSIEVTVKFLDHSSTNYSNMYMLDQTIQDVVADIKKSAGKSIRRLISGGETLEFDTTIADLVAKGYLKDLTAVVNQ